MRRGVGASTARSPASPIRNSPNTARTSTVVIVTQNVVVGHFSSNQGGWSIGGGLQHRFAGWNGDGKTRIFAEARYLDVLTPAVTTQPNGLGTTTVGADTKIIPVTVGVRF